MDNINNQYVPVRERIFYQMKSKSISQKEFAKILGVEAPTVTDWKTGRSFSFMKKLKPIADALETTEDWLLNGVTDIISMDGTLTPQESIDDLFDHAKLYSELILRRLKEEIDQDQELLARLNTLPCAMDIFVKIYEYGKWYFEPTISFSAPSAEVNQTTQSSHTAFLVERAYAQAEPGIQAAVRKLLDVEEAPQEYGHTDEAM